MIIAGQTKSAENNQPSYSKDQLLHLLLTDTRPVIIQIKSRTTD